MDALQLLTTRHSEKKLISPAPTRQQLEQIFQAALHTPDHGKLHPYRFVVIEKEGLNKFTELLKEAVLELDLGQERLKKAENLSQRAPMIIGVIAKINPDIEKIPAWEQMITAGCAAYAMQLAANAQGFDNVWISGPWVKGSALRQAFDCEKNDKIIALLMLGTAEQKSDRGNRELNLDKFMRYL